MGPKPDDVSLPDGEAWADISQDRRWHYRNRRHNTERTLRRRARLRAWIDDRKSERGCADCDATDSPVLDLHHVDPERNGKAISETITHGYGRDRLREETENCEVLCANCHRTRHDGRLAVVRRGGEPRSERERLRRWSYRRRAEAGCRRCDETDPVRLDFHHPETKSASVSRLISDGVSERRVRSEVEPCVVLCANCHRREHHEPPRNDTDGRPEPDGPR